MVRKGYAGERDPTAQSSVPSRTTDDDHDLSSSLRDQTNSVRFSQQIQIHIEESECSYIRELTLDHIERVWWSSVDYTRMKAQNRETAMLMEKRIDLDGVEQTSRGLEGKTMNGTMRRHDQIHRAINAVLDEQDRLEAVGEKSERIEASISELYAKVSRLSSLEAIFRAKQDRKEVLQFEQETSTTSYEAESNNVVEMKRPDFGASPPRIPQRYLEDDYRGHQPKGVSRAA